METPPLHWPPLHCAIIQRDLESIEYLISAGADVNQMEPDMGNTPLHLAAQNDIPAAIPLLLQAGAFVNVLSPQAGHSPLMIAAWYGKIDNMRALLQAPDINIYVRSPHGGATAKDLIGGWDPNPSASDQERNAALHQLLSEYETSLQSKIEAQTIYQTIVDPSLSLEEKEKRVQELIEKGETVNTESYITGTGNDRHSPLLVAARDNYPSIVALLLEAGADIGQRGYLMNAIPFHKAAYMGHPEVMQLLVNHPDAPTYINDQGPNNGYTPLHDAIWHGHTETARILVQAGARLDLKTYEGDTPLMLAQRYNYGDIIAMLEEEI